MDSNSGEDVLRSDCARITACNRFLLPLSCNLNVQQRTLLLPWKLIWGLVPMLIAAVKADMLVE